MPRAVSKAIKDKAEKHAEKAIRQMVFNRDGGKCRVCGGTAYEMHELKYRSLGGVPSLTNSIAVCNYKGRQCHALLQTHAIEVEGENANERLVFHWNRSMVKKGEEPFRIKSKRRSQNKDAA